MNSGIGLLIVFGAIILVLNITKKLYLSVIAGTIAAVICFSVPINAAFGVTVGAVTSWDTLKMVLILFTITFLQRMLEKNGDITKAQRSIDALSNNRRINTCLSPIIIGFLPAAGVVKIAGDIVSETAEDYLDDEEKAFVSTYYRHISESILPTYTSILLAISLSGVATSSFVLGMLPMVIVQIMLGYVFYLRKLPKQTKSPPSTDRKKDWTNIISGLWPLVLVIALILAFKNFNVGSHMHLCSFILGFEKDTVKRYS